MKENNISEYSPWKMLGYLFLIQISIAFVARSLAPLGIVIGENLNLTMFQIGLFPAALFLGQSVISIPAGFLSDKIGSKKVILLIILTLSGSFYAIALSSSFLVIIIFIIITGFSYGASHPSTNKGIYYWFDSRSRGTAMGIKQTGVTIGSALAALVLLPLASQFSWQFAFITAASSIIIIGVIFFIKYYEPAINLKERKEKENFAILKLLKSKKLMLITASAMLLSGSQAILNTFIIIYAYESLKLSIGLASILLVISEIGGAFGRICWGWVSDTLFSGKRIVILLIISVLVGVQAVITSLMSEDTPFYIVCIVIFLFGLGSSGFNGIWMNATSEVVPSKNSGIATGVSITLSSWGAILLPPLFGIIIDWTNSHSIGWLLITFMMLLSIIFLIQIVENNT